MHILVEAPADADGATAQAAELSQPEGGADDEFQDVDPAYAHMARSLTALYRNVDSSFTSLQNQMSDLRAEVASR
jgi:hypothetical protein